MREVDKGGKEGKERMVCVSLVPRPSSPSHYS